MELVVVQSLSVAIVQFASQGFNSLQGKSVQTAIPSHLVSWPRLPGYDIARQTRPVYTGCALLAQVPIENHVILARGSPVCARRVVVMAPACVIAHGQNLGLLSTCAD